MKRLLTLVTALLLTCACFAQDLSLPVANSLGGRWRLFGLSAVQDVTTGTQGYANSGYTFTVSTPSVNPTFGAVYKDANNVQYTAIAYKSNSFYVFQVVITGNPPASGTLTKVSGTGDATLTYSAVAVGTGQSTCTDRVQWTQQCTVVDPMFLFSNGYWTSSLFNCVGNSLTIKPYFEIAGNRIPIVLPSTTTTALATSDQAGAHTTVTTTTSNSVYVTVGSTTYMPVGSVIKDVTAGTSATVKAVVDSTHVVLSSGVTWTGGDTITVTNWPGEGFVIPDGGMYWSQHITGLELLAGTNYQVATYQSVPATGVIAKCYSYSYLSAQRSSDFLWGGTTDGGDYTNIASLAPGFATSAAFYYGPTYAVGRQIGTPVACSYGIGDSTTFGNGNVSFAGFAGTAINSQSGCYAINGGLGGATVGNLVKLGAGNIFSICQFADHIYSSVDTNDTANNETPAQIEGYDITLGQLSTAYGSDIVFMSIPPRAASSSDNYTTYSGQTPSPYTAANETISNWFRDTSPNGATTAMRAAGVNYSGYFGDIDQVLEKSSTGATPTFTATTYTFTITAPTTAPAFLATYKDANNNVYTVGPSIAGETLLYTTILSPGTCPASGTLTNVSGTGDATLTYSAVTKSSANQLMYGTGGYWVVNGTANWPTSDGTHPSSNINSLVAPYVLGTYAGGPGNVFAKLNTTIPSSMHPCAVVKPFKVLPSLIDSINSVDLNSLSPR